MSVNQSHTTLKRIYRTINQRFYLQCCLILIFLFFLKTYLNTKIPFYHVLVITGCACIYALYFLYQYHQKRFLQAYKQHFVSAVIQEVFPGAVLEFQNHLSYSSLLKSGFFLEGSYLSGEDLICTPYKNTHIQFSNIRLRPFSAKNKDDKPLMLPGQLFMGIVVEVIFNSPFPGTPLMILHQKMQHLRLPNHYETMPIESIKTLSSEFNKKFYVRGVDQIASRKLLQPALIDRITTVASQQPVSLSFIDNQLFLTLPQIFLEFNVKSFLAPFLCAETQIAKIQSSVLLIKKMIDSLGLRDR
jgi:hypothetical protein